MTKAHSRGGVDRRSLVKTGLVLAAAQFASPFVIRARPILEDVGEAEGQEQPVERILAVERADQQATLPSGTRSPPTLSPPSAPAALMRPDSSVWPKA
jgi:hypothetical protein